MRKLFLNHLILVCVVLYAVVMAAVDFGASSDRRQIRGCRGIGDDCRDVRRGALLGASPPFILG